MTGLSCFPVAASVVDPSYAWLDLYRTRAVQKLIETLKAPEQVVMVIAALKQGVVTLIKDLNGNHVVQRCLQRLSNDDSQVSWLIWSPSHQFEKTIRKTREGYLTISGVGDLSPM